MYQIGMPVGLGPPGSGASSLNNSGKGFASQVQPIREAAGFPQSARRNPSPSPPSSIMRQPHNVRRSISPATSPAPGQVHEPQNNVNPAIRFQQGLAAATSPRLHSAALLQKSQSVHQLGQPQSKVIDYIEEEMHSFEKQLADLRWENQELHRALQVQASEKVQLVAQLQRQTAAESKLLEVEAELAVERSRAAEFEKWSKEGQQRIQELISTVEAQKNMIEERDAKIIELNRTMADTDDHRQAKERLAAQLETMRKEVDLATSQAMLLAEDKGRTSLPTCIPEEEVRLTSVEVEQVTISRTPPREVAGIGRTSPVPLSSRLARDSEYGRTAPSISPSSSTTNVSNSMYPNSSGSATARGEVQRLGDMPSGYQNLTAPGSRTARDVPVSISRETSQPATGPPSRDSISRNVDPSQCSTPTSLFGGSSQGSAPVRSVMKPHSPTGAAQVFGRQPNLQPAVNGFSSSNYGFKRY